MMVRLLMRMMPVVALTLTCVVVVVVLGRQQRTADVEALSLSPNKQPQIQQQRQQQRISYLLPWKETTTTDATATTAVTAAKAQRQRQRQRQRQPAFLAWTKEEQAAGTGSPPYYRVTVRWQKRDNDHDDDSGGSGSVITVHLPIWGATNDDNNDDDQNVKDELARSLWPASLASAMLCCSPHWIDRLQSQSQSQQSSTGRSNSNPDQQQQDQNLLNLLELGCGMGLMGFVAGQVLSTSNANVVLTDHDMLTIRRLQQQCDTFNQKQKQQKQQKKQQESNNNNLDNINEGKTPTSATTKYAAKFLEWRTNHEEEEEGHDDDEDGLLRQQRHGYDVILGSDIAYYWYLLRGIIDTIQYYLSPDFGKVQIVGQANRESLWDLYDLVQKGGYNQLTDKHDQPWPGQTQMYLYRLQLGEWEEQEEEEEKTSDESSSSSSFAQMIPIAVLLHERNPSDETTNMSSDSDNDYIATEQDRENMMMSF